jgi:hypothetical protein
MSPLGSFLRLKRTSSGFRSTSVNDPKRTLPIVLPKSAFDPKANFSTSRQPAMLLFGDN